MGAVRITIFSDFACPYCYATEAALRRRAAGGGIEVDYRAFELYPMPAPLPASAEPPVAAVRALAAEERVGLAGRGPPTRTRKAHEAARAAGRRDLQAEMRAAIFAAYWSQARDIGRIDVLVELGRELGIDPSELKVALDIDQYTDAVLGDENTATRIGIQGVPALIVSYGSGGAAPRLVVGAQSYDQLDALIAGS